MKKITGDIDTFLDYVVERHELLRKHKKEYKDAIEVDLHKLRTLYAELLPYRYDSNHTFDMKWFQPLVVNSLGIGYDETDTELIELIYDNILLGTLYIPKEGATRHPITYEEIIGSSDRIKRLIEQGVLKEVRRESYEIEFK